VVEDLDVLFLWSMSWRNPPSTRSFMFTLAGWPQVATLTTVPPTRTDWMAWASTASIPAQG
jgi:hypothetical protein